MSAHHFTVGDKVRVKWTGQRRAWLGTVVDKDSRALYDYLVEDKSGTRWSCSAGEMTNVGKRRVSPVDQRKHEATHGWRNPPCIYEEHGE